MLRFKQIAGIVFNTFFFAVMLFVPAGTIRWPRAWIFLGVVFVGTAVTMFVLPEELLNERYKPPVQRGQPLFDQIGIFAFVGSFVAAVLFIPFDVFRLHLLRPPDIVTSIFGLGLFAAGWTLITVAMRANAFAAPVVEASEGARPARDRQRPISLRASSDVLSGHPAARRNVAMARLFCWRHRRNRTDGTDRNPSDT